MLHFTARTLVKPGESGASGGVTGGSILTTLSGISETPSVGGHDASSVGGHIFSVGGRDALADYAETRLSRC